jgi:tetratricopeptide (TPR) repeat protein
MGKFAAARRELDRSYTLCVATSRKPVMAEALTQLARAFVLSGNPAQALADLERAISIERDSGDRAGLSDTTVQLAATHLTLRHPQRALSLAREAAQTAASIDHPEALWQAHTVAGKALLRLSRHEEAAAEFDRAIETIETLRRRVVGPATALPAYFADKLEPYHQRMSLALESNRVAEALHYAEESKARALRRSPRRRPHGRLQVDEPRRARV